jgi:hypothetical protein
MNKISKGVKKVLLTWVGSGALLTLFLVATEPLKLPLPVLLVPFMVFAVWIRSGVILAGLLLRGKDRPGRKLRVVADSLAAVLLLVVTLQSLGQLSWRDILLVLGLAAGLSLYFYKTDLV